MRLPEIKTVKELPVAFPRRWQAVIFINYGVVPTASIASVIGTDEATVIAEADRLGLGGIEYDPVWIERGYVTVIRSNWNILDYDGICKLLGWDEDTLAFTLKEDDFLSVKLGDFKPVVSDYKYSPLTEEECLKTREIGDFVQSKRITGGKRPFDFYNNYPVVESVAEYKRESIVYSYAALYGDFLLDGDFNSFPEGLLVRLQKAGVTGIWMQGLLSKLAYNPFSAEKQENYLKRRKNLKLLVKWLAKFDIKLYLYINEPRSLPSGNLPEEMRGHTENGYSAMCSSSERTWEYLYSAVYELMSNVPELGGLITITMSENLTHCRYRTHTNCPRCSSFTPQELAAKVNNTIYRAVRDAGSSASVIANIWGWNFSMEWTDEQLVEGINLLEPGIDVMSVSETALKIDRGGVDNLVLDYSISCGRESEYTKKAFYHAKKRGHRIFAKVQVNNSWECCAAPYIPVFDLIYDHVSSLKGEGVEGYMMSWTLGGYPSLALDLATSAAYDKEFDLECWYRQKFLDQAEAVHSAIKKACTAFLNLPFDINLLYLSPVNYGPSNLWYKQATERNATMVGFPFDDLESWRGRYPCTVFLDLLDRLVSGFEEAVSDLEKCKETPYIAEILRFLRVCHAHYKSTLLLSRFVITRCENIQLAIELIDEEAALTETLYGLCKQDARIGFEASNHYLYNENSLLLKLVSLRELKNSF